MFTVLFAYVVFFFFFLACFVAADLCTSGCPDRFIFPTHNSFFNTSDSYLKSARA